jgi:diamine N-acetyltransferase
MLELRKITRANRDAILALSVFDGQKGFVASNKLSLEQAKQYPECVPLGVYDGDEAVGFVMYDLNPEDNEYWIPRVMIDKNHQRKGHGKAAMQLVLALIEADKEHDRVYLSFEPHNTVAKALYEQLGFKPDGRELEGEIVYCLKFQRN